jgi:hypothetical protein
MKKHSDVFGNVTRCLIWLGQKYSARNYIVKQKCCHVSFLGVQTLERTCDLLVSGEVAQQDTMKPVVRSHIANKDTVKVLLIGFDK